MFPGSQQYQGLPGGFGQGQGWAQGPGQSASWASPPGAAAPGPYGSQAPPPYSSPAGAYHAGQAPAQQQYAGQAPTQQQYAGQAPAQQQYAGQAPAQQQYAGQAPAQQQYAAQAPAQQQYTAQAPAQQQYAAQAPTQQQYAGQQTPAGYVSPVGAGGQYRGYSNVPQYGYQQQPQSGRYAPATAQVPAAPPGISPDVWQWFVSVDTDRSGKITAEELRLALVNGNWTPFNQETCRLMIGMFDRDRSGTIDVYEFGSLWKYIQDWKTCFDNFDRDRSGSIDCNELQHAFRTFGYTLSQQFCQLCVRAFDRNHTSSMKFDDFIQCCVMLKTLTDQFRVRDTAQQGMIRISYEDYLEMVLNVGVGQG